MLIFKSDKNTDLDENLKPLSINNYKKNEKLKIFPL